MFTKNETHLQKDLFGIEGQLSKAKKKKLHNSKEMYFYKEIFCKIDEADFSCLFSAEYSRPNAPVNALVASSILKEHNGWTIDELLKRIDFDLLTRTALGLSDLSETPFCPATYFNFQNRILDHFLSTGENLIEHVFDKMTASQLKRLKIKTDIQRMDSFQALSNIRSYSRIQLLIEMLLRLYRVLSNRKQKLFKELLSPYLSQTSSKYVYGLKGSDITHELEKLAEAYHKIYSVLNDTYSQKEVFQIFARVYTEHFTVVSGKIKITDAKEISSGSLQSPDDLDATFRSKNGKKHKGQVVNVCETANPDNELNLITDVTVAANNTDDSKLLNERLDKIKSKTPDLNELHTDGAYGSADNDLKMEVNRINHVQTAVRGPQAQIEMRIEETAPQQYLVSCPGQQVVSEKTRTRFKASFNTETCAQCPQADRCQTIKQKKKRVFYFDEDMVRLCRRAHAIEKLPAERQKLRPNVEATVKEFCKGFNHKGKLRVRGWFKTMLFAFFRSIAINLGRIYRYMRQKPTKSLSPGLIRFALLLFHSLSEGIRSFSRSDTSSIPNFQRTVNVINLWTKVYFYPRLAF